MSKPETAKEVLVRQAVEAASRRMAKHLRQAEASRQEELGRVLRQMRDALFQMSKRLDSMERNKSHELRFNDAGEMVCAACGQRPRA
jgi:acyl-CoA reductase-like NAD-dependent aldehyde dehydrogenase